MKKKLKLIWFWAKSITYITWHIMHNRNWHMIYVDYQLSDPPDTPPKRHRLIAKQSVGSSDLYWEKWL